MNRRRSGPALWLALAMLPAGAAAQNLQDCVIVSSNRSNFYGSEGAAMQFFGGGARFSCSEGTRIAADSVARYQATGIIDFIGRVRYNDRDNLLTAERVRYMEGDKSAVAQGNVVLTDQTTGSVIKGPLMNYYRATEQRPEALIQITSGRPHAVLVSVAKADSARRDTTVVDADQMDIIGRDRFNGRGNVDLVRSDVHGTGQFAAYDREAGNLRFWMNAKLETPDYTLTGDTVHGRTDASDRMEEVTALVNGQLIASDVNVEAPRIRVLFEDGEVSRLVAVGKGRAADSTRTGIEGLASAISRDFRLTADSIDAIAPMRELERVTAVGRAYGERLTEDLGDATLPSIAARDWMKGDTVIAYFIEAPPPPDDTTGTPTRQVERVVAIGIETRASSSYRVADEKNPDGPPGVNYMLAKHIVVNMRDGAVATVDATGSVQGVYLQPEALAAPPPRGTGRGADR